MPNPTFVTLTQVIPKGKALTFHLSGDATRSRSGAGGWQIVDRPRRTASTQWLDASPRTLAMDLLLDGIGNANPAHARNLEAECATLDSWEVAPAGQLQTPVLTVAGPVPHSGLKWVLQTLSLGGALRNTSGHRIQQQVSVTLLEYVPPTIVVTGSSPAQAAQQRQSSTSSSTSTRRYTVKSGDTLSAIAARELGDANRWPDIAKLNNLRDPNALSVGQVLLLPPS